MSRSRKFIPPFAVACALLAAFGVTLVGSNAAQLGAQPVGIQPIAVHPTFDQKGFRAPNLGTQRTVGIANNLNKNRNISKGISPDG
jgi:hypothetical protein